MELKDAVFIYINTVNGYITGAEYQLDCAYIRSYLGKFGLETMQYINKNIKRYSSIIRELINIQSKCYVFYINEYNYYINKLIINALKKIDSSLSLYIIGVSSNFISTNLLNEIKADVCLVRNAAFSLKELLLECNEVDKICNLVYKVNNEVLMTKTKDISYTLDELGLPYSSNFIPPEEIQNVGMISSTGCYGECSFCSYNTDQTFKTHSISSIIHELKHISKYISGKNVLVNFLDDCFSVSSERTIRLCNEIISNDLQFQFWCCTRADLLSKEVVDVMADSNFKNIVIGLESASCSVLSRLGKLRKGDNSMDYISNLRDMFHYAVQKGINPYISVNFGLPYEKLYDALETIHFIRNNNATKNTSICFTTCFPGSKIFENNSSYNIYQ